VAFAVQLWGPILFFPLILLLINPRKFALRTWPRGAILLPSRETCLDPSPPPSRHISAATKYLGDSRRVSSSPHCLWHLVRWGDSRHRSICEIRFYGRYAIAPLPLSDVGALDHCLTGIAVIAWEGVCGCLHPLCGDFVGTASSRTQFTVPNLRCSRLRLVDLSNFAGRKNVFFLRIFHVDWSSEQSILAVATRGIVRLVLFGISSELLGSIGTEFSQ